MFPPETVVGVGIDVGVLVGTGGGVVKFGQVA